MRVSWPRRERYDPVEVKQSGGDTFLLDGASKIQAKVIKVEVGGGRKGWTCSRAQAEARKWEASSGIPGWKEQLITIAINIGRV